MVFKITLSNSKSGALLVCRFSAGGAQKRLRQWFLRGGGSRRKFIREEGLKQPDKEFKGSFNVRLKPKIHRLAAIRSAALKISLNQFVESVLEKEDLETP